MTESIYEEYTQQSSSISIPLTMEIHIGKEHYENFEYGICIFTGESQQILEMHLFTCEMFECVEWALYMLANGFDDPNRSIYHVMTLM
jgi:hypothetical protein